MVRRYVTSLEYMRGEKVINKDRSSRSKGKKIKEEIENDDKEEG